MTQLLPHLNFPISLYHLRCKKCKKDFYAEINDEMGSWEIKHCDKCNNVIRINWLEPLSKKVEIKARIKGNKWDTRLIESYLKPCSCGGKFLYSAKPRCPYCHSDQIEKLKGVKHKFITYDPDSIWKDEVKNL